MPESGGVTTQSGIYYQNSVAALWLGRLLDLRPPANGSSQVTSVRVEAPQFVDDIVVRHSDGSTLYIQAKENLSTSGDAWAKFWVAASNQVQAFRHEGDRIELVVGTLDKSLNDLREALERAQGKNSEQEWLQALSANQLKCAKAIVAALPQPSAAFDVVRATRAVPWTLDHIESVLLRDWMQKCTATPTALFSHLRDLCGGHARVRATFSAATLSETLQRKFQIRIAGSQGDALEAYRAAVASEAAHLSVPGTSISADEADLLVIPTIRLLDRNRRFDFEDEDPRAVFRGGNKAELVDLSTFPSGDCRTIVLESGAGQGKTTLLRAVARRLAASTTILPVLISAEALQGCNSIFEYLADVVNVTYEAAINWRVLAETGRLAILIDGVDEIDDAARATLLTTIARTAARYNDLAFLVAARDAAITVLPPSFTIYRIERLDFEQRTRMLKAYLRQRPDLEAPRVMAHVRDYAELEALCTIPLFLAIFVATLPANGAISTSRREVLDRYLEVALSPTRHKGSPPPNCTALQLRRGARALALLALERTEIAISADLAEACLESVLADRAEACLATLIRYGLLQRRGGRFRFSIPTVQEYLAGCALAENGSLDASELLKKIYRRPWAQAIQFAIEHLRAGDDILRRIANGPDDLYHTSLRLVARCIANGAAADSSLRNLVAHRLAHALVSADWGTRIKVAQLIEDGFCKPPADVLRALLCVPANDAGRAGIIRKIDDPELTRLAFTAVMRGPDLRELWASDWEAALKPVLAFAMPLMVARARGEAHGSLNLNVLAGFFYHMGGEPGIDWSAIYNDLTLPAVIRCAARAAAGIAPDFSLLRVAAREGTHTLLWQGFATAFVTFDGWEDHLLALGRSGDENDRRAIHAYFASDTLETEILLKYEKIFERLALDPNADLKTRFDFQILLALRGKRNFAEEATDALGDNDADIHDLYSWLEAIPFLPDDLVVRGAQNLRNQTIDIDTEVGLLADVAEGASLQPVGPPPGLSLSGTSYRSRTVPPAIAAMIEAWVDDLLVRCEEPSDIARLLGARLLCRDYHAARELMAFVKGFLNTIDVISSEEWSWIFTAIILLEKMDVVIDVDLLWQVIAKGGDCPLGSTIERILDQEGERCFPLIERYWSEGSSRSARHGIIHWFERNAPRLGLIIDIENGALSIQRA